MTDLPMPAGGETSDERIVGIDQIFFSTTDMKGVITGANRTFSKISKYSQEELLGAPHSLIRHDDMPGGVFKIMWDRLAEGKPVAAYVKNRANDGLIYWVFATVTPVRDGYLSVRTRPVFRPLWDAADGLYQAVRPAELHLREQGGSRIDAAAAGEGMLDQGLKDAGFSGFEEFMMAALPEEVALREELASDRPVSRALPGSTLGDLIGGAQYLEQRIIELLANLGSLGELSRQLGSTLRRQEHARTHLVQAATEAMRAAESIAELPSALVSSTAAIYEWVRRASDSIDRVSGSLSTVAPKVASSRFEIALARLHNHMVLSFAEEISSGAEDAPAAQFMPLLCETMAEDIERMSVELEDLRAALQNAEKELQAGMVALQRAREFIASWQLQVGRYGVSELDSTVLRVSDSQMQVLGQLAEMVDLAESCRELADTIDPYSALDSLPVILAAAEEILAQELGQVRRAQ